MIKKPWKTSEVKTIKNGEIPEGRTYHAVQQFCCRMNLQFPGKRFSENNFANKVLCIRCQKICKKDNKVTRGFLCNECMENVMQNREFIEKTLNVKRNLKMFNTLMIDIETTGTKPGCKVLSIGAFGFNEEGQQVEFYERISPTLSAEFGLVDDLSAGGTMEWWEKQDDSALMEAFGGTKGPEEVLAEFKQFFYKNFNPGRRDIKFTIWSCGIDFDFPIICELFSRTGVSQLWKFWQQRDYRTLKELFPEIKNAEVNVEKHNALEDAKAQMRGLRYFYSEIKPRLA